MIAKLRQLKQALRVACAMIALTLPVIPANAQLSSMRGSVVDDVKERPLANAQIALTDLNLSTRSDSIGQFILSQVPIGQHLVVVRLVGYEPFSAKIQFRMNETVEADILLKLLTTQLDTLAIRATSNAPWGLKLQDFEERRRGGIGKYLTADVFQRADGRPPSAIIQSYIAGLRVIQSNGRRVLASARGPSLNTPDADESFQKAPKGCLLQVVVNGVPVYTGVRTQEVFDLDQFNSMDIIGFEYYTVATTPLRYGGTTGGASRCGTVIIWTK